MHGTRTVPAAYCWGYPEDVDIIRENEYPLLKGTPHSSNYLDYGYSYFSINRHSLSRPRGDYSLPKVTNRLILPRTNVEPLRQSAFYVRVFAAVYPARR